MVSSADELIKMNPLPDTQTSLYFIIWSGWLCSPSHGPTDLLLPKWSGSAYHLTMFTC